MSGDPQALHWFEDCPERVYPGEGPRFEGDLAVTIAETTCLQCVKDLGRRGMLPEQQQPDDDPPWT